MQFKYPEILYALLLLIIPIIVHLFQFRRFEKVEFTNVQILKTIQTQTRRSSQIKKWLVLFTRLIILACTVLAFAQPYRGLNIDSATENELVVYLDNSFSMQARGNNGTLLNTALYDLFTHVDEDDLITLFTNDLEFPNTTLKTIKNDLIELSHSSFQLDYDAVIFKGEQAFSENIHSLKNFLIISDFQDKSNPFPHLSDTVINHQLVQLKPKTINNVSIDSLHVSKENTDNLELTVHLSNHGEPIEALSVSLLENEQLRAKSAVAIVEKAETVFTIPHNKIIKGMVLIEDPNLKYDNSLYFSLNRKAHIKVLAISDDKANTQFLKNLYTSDEFDLTVVNIKDLNYNTLENQHLIILNEIKNMSNALIDSLKSFINDGGSILIIPSYESNIVTYNQLLNHLNLPQFKLFNLSEKRITTINFDHPLLDNVFDKKVDNFQYPTVNSYYELSQPPSSPILEFEGGVPFLIANHNAYVFSAAISGNNSNFISSPLIVPVLYNIGKQSLKTERLYYEIGQKHHIDIQTKLNQDEILTLKNKKASLIPQQQTFSNKVEITTDETPIIAGHYDVTNKDSVIKNLSYNYNRKESHLRYIDVSQRGNNLKNVSITSVLEDIKSTTNVNELWKWFVIFALVVLIIEMLILKFLK